DRLPRTWLVAIAGLVALGAASAIDWTGQPLGWVLALPLVALATAAVIVAVCGPDNPISKGLSSPPLVALGRISYALYLWHYIVFWVAQPATANVYWPIRFALLSAISILIAVASWRYVEHPILRMRSRSLRELGAAPPTVPEATPSIP